jgi:hypothetical protein
MHNPKTLVALGLSLATHVSGAMALRAPLLHVVETAAHPSNMSELDSPKPFALFPPEPTSPCRGARRWQWLVVPLMGLSLLLHMVVLFVPIPSQDRDLEVPEEEAPSLRKKQPLTSSAFLTCPFWKNRQRTFPLINRRRQILPPKSPCCPLLI